MKHPILENKARYLPQRQKFEILCHRDRAGNFRPVNFRPFPCSKKSAGNEHEIVSKGSRFRTSDIASGDKFFRTKPRGN